VELAPLLREGFAARLFIDCRPALTLKVQLATQFDTSSERRFRQLPVAMAKSSVFVSQACPLIATAQALDLRLATAGVLSDPETSGDRIGKIDARGELWFGENAKAQLLPHRDGRRREIRVAEVADGNG
jgi:hypothetical protein